MSKPSPDDFYTSIEHNILRDMEACEALLSLLQREREQLVAREHDELDNIIQQKNHWLSQLENSAKIRSGWLAQSPLNHNLDPAEAWQAFLVEHHKPDLVDKWLKLKNMVQACRDENEINGKLITRSQATFKRLINIIRGQDENAALYTGKGGKKEAYNKHTLGQA